MQKTQTFQPGAFWLVTGAAILWGTIGVATKAIYALDNPTSLFLNLARMAIATPILFFACWRVMGRRTFHIRRRDLAIMILNGTLLAVSQSFYFAAIRASGVTIATLLTICLSPFIVIGLAVPLKLETVTRRTMFALGCALIGAILLVGFDTPANGQTQLWTGVLLSVLAALFYGGSVVCSRLLAVDTHPLQATAFTFASGTGVLTIINLISGVDGVQTPSGLLLLLYLGVVPSALAYLLFQIGLRSVSATAASIVSMLDPVVAAALAWVMFGETLAVTGIAGAALLLASIYLLSGDKRS